MFATSVDSFSIVFDKIILLVFVVFLNFLLVVLDSCTRTPMSCDLMSKWSDLSISMYPSDTESFADQLGRLGKPVKYK